MEERLAISTDYIKDKGSPQKHLERISKAGFTHVMWCHHSMDDYIYSESEINQISKWLKKYKLECLYVHVSRGQEKNYISNEEYIREAGVELVKNRIYLASKLNCNIVVIHLPPEPQTKEEQEIYYNSVFKTLDELKPYVKKHNVKIAFENLADFNVNCNEIKVLFSKYKSSFIGFCFDTGHGNLSSKNKYLELFKDRLFAIHLNDNDSHISNHNQIFSGTVNWEGTAQLIAQSSYKECMCLELITKNEGEKEEMQFLREAYKLGIKFSKMVEKYKN